MIIILSLNTEKGTKQIGFDVDAVSDVRHININEIQEQDMIRDDEVFSSIDGVFMDGDEALVIVNSSNLMKMTQFELDKVA